MKTFDAKDLDLQIPAKQLKPLFKVKSHVHALAMVFDWLIIFGTIIFAINYFNPVTYFMAIIIVGARMHALAILMHDATHFRFLKNRRLNDELTNIFTMYPLFLTIEKYRINHLAHHQHLNTEEDPDWVSKLPKKEFEFPKTKRAFIATILSYFLLIQGIKDAIWFVSRFNIIGGSKTKKNKKKGSLSQPIFYITLIAILSVMGWWTYFLIFWVVPYFSTFLMFQYIRSVSEHFGELEYDHLLNASRTVKTNAIERFLIAPHNVGYHIEHHLYPGVPFYNLPPLHELLMNDPEFKDKAHVTRGYFSGLMNELGRKDGILVNV